MLMSRRNSRKSLKDSFHLFSRLVSRWERENFASMSILEYEQVNHKVKCNQEKVVQVLNCPYTYGRAYLKPIMKEN